MIIFIAGVFSGYILVKMIILSELHCCNMIISVSLCNKDSTDLIIVCSLQTAKVKINRFHSCCLTSTLVIE